MPCLRSPCALSPHIIQSQPAFLMINMLQFGHFLPNVFMSATVAASSMSSCSRERLSLGHACVSISFSDTSWWHCTHTPAPQGHRSTCAFTFAPSITYVGSMSTRKLPHLAGHLKKSCCSSSCLRMNRN